jgi:hypothetical protein
LIQARSARADASQDQVEAKSHFDAGLLLYREGAYDAALVEFQESYRLGKRVSALRNVAQCHRDRKDFAAAHETYERLLATHGAEVGENERKEIARALAEIERVTGMVELQIPVPGATVRIGAKVIEAAPENPRVRANVGEHAVRVAKDGFGPFEGAVTVVAQQTASLRVDLRSQTPVGRVRVRAEDGGAVPILVDGARVGTTPWAGDLPTGKHTIRLSGPSGQSEPQEVTVEAGRSQDLTLKLIPATGRLEVQVRPLGATILIDGAYAGRGAWVGDLKPGAHRVQVSFPGKETEAVMVDVAPGATVSQRFELASTIVAERQDPRPSSDPASTSGAYFGLDLNVDVYRKGFEHVPCPEGVDPDCDESTPKGGALRTRLGYSFGVLGLEALLAARAQVFEDTRRFYNVEDQQTVGSPLLPYAYAHTEVFLQYNYGVFLGFGARVATEGDARLTLGTSLGVSHRVLRLRRDTRERQNSFLRDYSAPAVAFDAGILLGSTPGTKLFLGMAGQLDFPSQDVTATDQSYNREALPQSAPSFDGPAPQYTVASGTQVFFGPLVGVQFGH